MSRQTDQIADGPDRRGGPGGARRDPLTPPAGPPGPTGAVASFWLASLPAEPVVSALSRARPLGVLPSLASALGGYKAAIASDPAAKQRLASYESALGSAVEVGWLQFSRWEREPSGRIRLLDPSTQQVAGVLREHFVPSSEGHVFVDCDWKSAHVAIAAARSGDRALQAALRDGDVYAQIGSWLAPDTEPALMRRGVKRAVLALLNGGTPVTCASYLVPAVGDRRAVALGARLHDEWWASFSALRRLRDETHAHWMRHAHDEFVAVYTLIGLRRDIPVRAKGRRAWKTLLSALWSSVEAEAMDYVLEHLDGAVGELGGAVVQPMYDGVLVEVPREGAAAAAVRLRDLMTWAMTVSGVPGVSVDIEVHDRWGVGR